MYLNSIFKTLWPLLIALIFITVFFTGKLSLYARTDTEVENLLTEAETLLEKGDYKGARELIEKAIKLNPSSGEAYYLSGKVYQAGFNDFKGAIKEYQKALKYSPDFGEVHFNIGACYYKLNNIEKAIVWMSYSRILFLKQEKYDKYESAMEILIKITTDESDVKKAYEDELKKFRINPQSIITPTPSEPTPAPPTATPTKILPTSTPEPSPTVPVATATPKPPKATPTEVDPGHIPTPTIIPIILPGAEPVEPGVEATPTIIIPGTEPGEPEAEPTPTIIPIIMPE